MSDVSPRRHAFTHAPAALRIFRFAADVAPRVLELAHVSAFLRECAVEFGSVDAALPAALRNEGAAKRFFELRGVVAWNASCCPWLAAKLLACRGGAPVPAAALAPDVTRHDVDWGAEGARRHPEIVVSESGALLTLDPYPAMMYSVAWAQGPVGVTSGKHWFSVSVSVGATRSRVGGHYASVGWVDRALRTDAGDEQGPGFSACAASGAVFASSGRFQFGTAPLAAAQQTYVQEDVTCPCTIGCLLDADAGAMTVFVDGEALAQQCEFKFPTDGREWAPTVGLSNDSVAVLSSAV
jgi:hypothetical protein